MFDGALSEKIEPVENMMFKEILENNRNFKIMDPDGRYIDLLFIPPSNLGKHVPRYSQLHSAFIALELIKGTDVRRKGFEDYLNGIFNDYKLKERALDVIRKERRLVDDGTYANVLKLSKEGAKLLEMGEIRLYGKPLDKSNIFDSFPLFFKYDGVNIAVPSPKKIFVELDNRRSYLEKMRWGVY